MQNVFIRATCRACDSNKLVEVLDLGKTPPANAFLTKSGLKKKEKKFPLVLIFCPKCSMVQLKHVVDPKLLFENYVYKSSTSPVFVRHFEDMAERMTKRFKLKKPQLVIDIGSNDGILLKPYIKRGMRVLGIEPAANIAKMAKKSGVPTVVDFFSEKLAIGLAKKNGKARLITATNVFAHIDDVEEVARGVKVLLGDGGVFLVEVSYLFDVIKNNLFDIIYHEHLSYWSVRSLKAFFERMGLKLFDVQHVNTHGGSIRILVEKANGKYRATPAVTKFLQLEKQAKLHSVATYRRFVNRVDINKRQLGKLLKTLKQQGGKIAGYGAPAKTTTLLHYFKITKNLVDFIVDDSPLKQGLYTPGTHIPVVKAERVHVDKPNYMLILAWNFAESIMKAQQDFKNYGGKFIIPVPYPKVK